MSGGNRADAELRARGIDPDAADDRVTADEWIEVHRAEQTDADTHREIIEDYELDDHTVDDATTTQTPRDSAETDVADIRDTSRPNPDERSAPAARDSIPSVDETARDVARAQVALREIENRRQQERGADTDRADELARWNTDDHTDAVDDASGDADTDVDVLER